MVDIVIVNWNSGEYLKMCLTSILKKDNNNLINRIIIIDNNSKDLFPADIPNDNRVILIQNNQNVGFSKACNQGFRQCTAEFILLLNPDAMLLPDTLSDSIHFMRQHNDIDILGCCLLDDQGVRTKSCCRFPSPVRIFFDAAGLSKIAPKIFTPASIMTDWDHLESRSVDMVMGAFMFMRKNVFEKNGFFDERFFVYYEEVDFSKRLSAIQGKIFYNAFISAVHSGEGTTKSVKAFRLFLSLKSRLQYAKKHFRPKGFIIVWISTFFVEPFTRILFLLSKGKVNEIGETLKGFMLLIKNKPLH